MKNKFVILITSLTIILMIGFGISNITASNKGVNPISNPCPGTLTCQTVMCGGTDQNPYVCCPTGYPYLEHCYCKCYESSNDFSCGSYSYCQDRSGW